MLYNICFDYEKFVSYGKRSLPQPSGDFRVYIFLRLYISYFNIQINFLL